MSEISNIRKLLTDPSLGLLPNLERRLKDLETNLINQRQDFHLEGYDLDLGKCQTDATANEPRPLVTQAVSMKFPMTGRGEDKFELLLLASEFQNKLDTTIFQWSNLEWSQFEKPLKRQVTHVAGRIDYTLIDPSVNSCRITVYRDFDLTYTVTF